MYEYNPQYGDMISSQEAEVLRQLEYDDKQKQMQAQIDRMNEKYRLSDLVAPQQVAAMQPQSTPRGMNPIITDGEISGYSPQATVPQANPIQFAQVASGRADIPQFQTYGQYANPREMELANPAMVQRMGGTPRDDLMNRQLRDLMYSQDAQSQDPYKRAAAMMQGQQLIEGEQKRRQGLEDEALKRRKATADTLKAEMDLRPKAEKVDETSEQKNYRFAMSLPENMRQPFLEKLGMSRKPEKDADAKRAAQMEGIGDVISQARAILTNKAPGQVSTPTQSGLGSIADTAAGWFGMSPSGASEADQLRVLGGVLTSKMPRMEGPQSEYDVKLYQEMAGKIGDSSVPIDRRVKALEQVQSLWKKYDKSGDGQGDSVASQQQSSQYVETRQTKAGLVGKKADGTLELIRR